MSALLMRHRPSACDCTDPKHLPKRTYYVCTMCRLPAQKPIIATVFENANNVLDRLTPGYQTTQLNDLTNTRPYSIYTDIVSCFIAAATVNIAQQSQLLSQ